MSGLFGILDIGKRALATNQLWMNTIGHNISNANTPGYTRQRVMTTTANPAFSVNGPLGTGVSVVGISNIKDVFMATQFRSENQQLGQWTSKEKTLSQIEQVLFEPSDGSIGSMMTEFWDSWSDLSTNPEDMTSRNTLITNAQLMTDSFQRIHGQLVDIQKSIDSDITLKVDRINTIADELAQVNIQIARTELGSDRANDLRDKRDILIDELSSLVKVSVREDSTGAATIFIGSLAIVEKETSTRIGIMMDKSGDVALGEIVYAGTKQTIDIVGGELKGLLDTRDNTIPDYIDKLDEMARSLVENVNAIHMTGYGLNNQTGLTFFDPSYTSASNIKLSDAVLGNPSNIAASSELDAIGNNVNALAISELRTAALMENGSVTLSSYYETMIGKVATESSKAKSMLENSTLLVAQADTYRQSVEGVSLDEEMAQLIKYQQSYDAAARIITAVDQALDTVINNMGMVGR